MDAKKRILLVEDEPDLLEAMERRLTTAGYDVVVAPDGQVALDLVHQQHPDLIVTDVLMPKMDGYAFFKELKNDKTTADIPILISTARGKMQESFEAVGANDFLSKPYRAEELLIHIENLLRRHMPHLHSTKKILLAGNDQDVLENMVFQLKDHGCELESAFNGPEVLTKCFNYNPQILILEVPMDAKVLAETIRSLRQIKLFEKTPIIIYSFYPLDLDQEDIQQKALGVDECLAAGATEYIGRFNEDTFLKTVSQYL